MLQSQKSEMYKFDKKQECLLVKGCKQNSRELSLNVILLFIMWVKREICKWQFSQFLVILSEKFVNFRVI